MIISKDYYLTSHHMETQKPPLQMRTFLPVLYLTFITEWLVSCAWHICDILLSRQLLDPWGNRCIRLLIQLLHESRARSLIHLVKLTSRNTDGLRFIHVGLEIELVLACDSSQNPMAWQPKCTRSLHDRHFHLDV